MKLTPGHNIPVIPGSEGVGMCVYCGRNEYIVIIYKMIYSVKCIHIACSSKKITASGSRQHFDENIL